MKQTDVDSATRCDLLSLNPLNRFAIDWSPITQSRTAITPMGSCERCAAMSTDESTAVANPPDAGGRLRLIDFDMTSAGPAAATSIIL